VQRVDTVGHRGGQVVLFPEVVAEIVEFALPGLEEFDELPVARADRAGRGGSPASGAGTEVAGEVPEEGVAVEFPLAAAGQETEIADAVDADPATPDGLTRYRIAGYFFELFRHP
jgi:hypothetical protein